MISLPSRWVKLNNLKKGDEVEVNEQGKKIVVSTDKEKESEYVEIDMKSIPDALVRRYITTAYKMGVDEVRILVDNPEIVEKIQTSLQKYLIGYEIIKQTKDHITIKSITGDLGGEFDSTLRRIFLLLLTMSKESFAAVKNNDVGHFKSIMMLEENNNRFASFCRRLLNKHGYKNQSKVTFVYLIVEQLEKIADEFKYIMKNCRDFKKSKKILAPETLELYASAVKFVELYYELFYNFDKNKVVHFIDMRDKILNEAYSLLRNKTNNDAVFAHHILCVIQRTYDILPALIALSLESRNADVSGRIV